MQSTDRQAWAMKTQENETLSQTCLKQCEIDPYIDMTIRQLPKIITPRRRKKLSNEIWKLATAKIALHSVFTQKSKLNLND